MSKNMNIICQICLRTDRKLKTVDVRLSDYHDELCEYDFDVIEPKYCMECEHLLRKVYNFRAKCKTANKILQKWKKTKVPVRKPLNELYTLIPNSLGPWIPDNNKVYTFREGEQPNADVGKSLVCSSNQVLANEDIKMEVEEEDHFTEVRLEDLLNAKTNDNANILEDIDDTKDTKAIVKKHDHLDDTSLNSADDVTEDDLSKSDITSDDDSDYDVKDDLLDVSSINSDDIDTKRKRPTNRNKVKGKQKSSSKKKSLTELANISLSDDYVNDDDIQNAGEVNISDNSDEKISDIDDDDIKKGDEKISDIDDDDISDDENISDIDDDDTITNGDESIIQNQRNILYNIDIEKEATEAEKNIYTILDDIGLHVDTIYEHWQDLSPDLTHVIEGNNSYIIDKNFRKKFLKKNVKKSIVSMITQINSDLCKINENCDNIVQPLSRKKIKAALEMHFASCGDLKSSDGVTIDKEFILNSIDDKVSHSLLVRLLSTTKGRGPRPLSNPKTLRMLKIIQIKYKRDLQYESVFNIEYNNTKEKMIEEFQKRVTYECYLKAAYNCDLCHQSFKYKKILEYHIVNSHSESAGNYACSICMMRFINKNRLKFHVDTHETVYKCKLCPLVLYYKVSVHNHYLQHKGVLHTCKICNLTYKSTSAYRTHMGKMHHASRFTCTTCGRAFASKRAVAAHGKIHWRVSTGAIVAAPNTKSESASCEQCDLKFPSQYAYREHLRFAHEVVGARKLRKRAVYTCRKCNAVGNSNGWLQLHFRTEHPSTDMALLYMNNYKYLCDVCGKGFASTYNLRDHINLHTGARPYACPKCPKRFHSPQNLNLHRLMHFPPNKACKICGKKFRSDSNLLCHMRGHIGNRHYKCSICGKGFLHRGTLNEHVRGVHHHVRRVKKPGATAAGTRKRARRPPSTEESSD